jgi:hypothetical protein
VTTVVGQVPPEAPLRSALRLVRLHAASRRFPVALALLAGCAAGLRGALWIGPIAYLLVGVYALYTDWHPPALTTPWIWPARPPHDVGGALCAALVFAIGMVAITVRGARVSAGD